MADPCAGKEGHDQPERHEDDGRAGVGLDEDERGGQRRDSEGEQEDTEFLQPITEVGEKLGQSDDRHQLTDLGRLDHGEAEIEPAARAELVAAEEEHGDQHDDAETVSEPAERVDQAVVEPGQCDHQHSPDQGKDDVSLHGAGEDDSLCAAGKRGAE